jgi:hypothetical protein
MGKATFVDAKPYSDLVAWFHEVVEILYSGIYLHVEESS